MGGEDRSAACDADRVITPISNEDVTIGVHHQPARTIKSHAGTRTVDRSGSTGYTRDGDDKAIGDSHQSQRVIQRVGDVEVAGDIERQT